MTETVAQKVDKIRFKAKTAQRTKPTAGNDSSKIDGPGVWHAKQALRVFKTNMTDLKPNKVLIPLSLAHEELEIFADLFKLEDENNISQRLDAIKANKSSRRGGVSADERRSTTDSTHRLTLSESNLLAADGIVLGPGFPTSLLSSTLDHIHKSTFRKKPKRTKKYL
jgi:hypothetical protein